MITNDGELPRVSRSAWPAVSWEVSVQRWALQMALLFALASACGPPSITTLSPASGPERTLVNVSGDPFLAHTIWDAGAAGEHALAGGFLGAYLFSVPAGAALGSHNVA